MLMDMSTLKTMCHLSEVTGGATKSANFAETYMDYYMTHLVDEKGLFWWGWHRHYDVYTDQMTGMAVMYTNCTLCTVSIGFVYGR